MKIIGKIIRGYFYLMLSCFIIVSIFDIINPGYRAAKKAMENEDSVTYKKKLIPNDDSKDKYWFNEVFGVNEILITYTCQYDKTSASHSSSSLEYVKLESVVPQNNYGFIYKHFQDVSVFKYHHSEARTSELVRSEFAKDLCSSFISKTDMVTTNIFQVRITDQ